MTFPMARFAAAVPDNSGLQNKYLYIKFFRNHVMLKQLSNEIYKTKKGEDLFTKHLVLWILLAALIIVIWLIINGIIRKLLTVY